MTSKLSFILLFSIATTSVIANAAAPIVNTLNGPIKGKHYETVFGKEILAFHRIPYIKPPIGSLRFKDPQPVDNWTEVLDCSLPPIPSLNKNTMLSKFQTVFEGDETAIHINAYTKTLTPDKLRPVMVWFHGGGFKSDSASTRLYSPDYLLEKDIVLFTVNYRLGVLGFLSLDDPKLEVPGNAGLKDQTMSLRWIKNNCERFGGDPNSITIFGESAGGSAVHFHTLSELSRGLFHRAILMSGTAFSPWATVRNQDFGLKLAKLLGWNDDESTEKALEILQNVNGTELLNASDMLRVPGINFYTFEPFLPIIEPYISGQCFIPKPLTEMMVDPWSKDMPFIISHTSNEGLIFRLSPSEIIKDIQDNFGDFKQFLPKELAINNMERKTEFGLRLKKLYFGEESPSVNNTAWSYNLMSDLMFIRSIHIVVNSRASNPSVPTYLLRFAFESKRFNHFKVAILHLNDEPGASHADDLSYLFKNDFYERSGGLPRDSKEFRTMQRMVDLYTNFAATGNPNGPNSDVDGATWEPLKTNSLPYKCLNVADNLELIDCPESDRMRVWDQLYADDLN